MNHISNIGKTLFIISGLIMVIGQAYSYLQWWGFFGLIIGISIPPLSFIFPLVYWWMEGVFPVGYTMIWAIGIAGGLLSGFFSKPDSY